MDTTRELVTQWMKDGSRLLAQLLNECVRATAALDEAKRKCAKLQEDLAALREENDRFRKERREALDSIAAALRTAGTAVSRFSDVPTVMAVSSLTETGEMAADAPSVEADVGPPALALPSGPSPRPEEPRATAPQRVLVVDDDESFRTMLAMHLRGRYEVTTAESGEEALGLLPSARPQLVLLDLRMPGIGGMQALQQIKALYPNLCVLMVTANDDRSSAQEALALGAADYLKKPFDLDYLDNVLEIYMTVSDAPPGTVVSAIATAVQRASNSPTKSPFTRPPPGTFNEGKRDDG